jgi:glycogen operon protein
MRSSALHTLLVAALAVLAGGCPEASDPSAAPPGAASVPDDGGVVDGATSDDAGGATDFGVSLGARIDDVRETVRFRLLSERATRVELDLFGAARGEDERLRVLLEKDPKTSVWTAEVPLASLRDAGIATIHYGYRCWGPNWPHVATWTKGSSEGFVVDVDADGNRFNPNKLVYDPYALELSHDPFSPEPFDGTVYELGPGNRTKDSGRLAPKGIVLRSEVRELGVRPTRALRDDVIYEVQVRGLTMKDPSVPEADRGTYRGAAAKAAYLRDLGVTAIELLPIHETQNEQNDGSPGSQNYWGYASNSFFAPDRRFAADKTPGGPTRELRDMVRAFHDQGIKVLVDVVYNHTGEGGPNHLLSWRGIDANAYYERGNDAYSFADNNGVGPNFHPRSAPARQLLLDSLRYYSQYLGIDGFRFDLASVLGDRCESYCFEFDKLAPENVLNRAVKELPARPNEGGAGVDLIAEPWAIGLGTYQVGSFPKGWSEWNGRYRDTLRAAENRVGVADVTPRELSQRVFGSPDLYADDGRPPSASVNFVVAHDGFTLRDLYSYNGKNNLQAAPFGPSPGGADDNVSWDHNGNGPAQAKAARTAMLLLSVSAGVPMLLGGDELYRTQRGNNNAYNLDNEASWLDWTALSSQAPFHAFVRGILRMRGDHPALRPSAHFDGKDHDGNGLPDVALLGEDGKAADQALLDSSTRRFLAMRLDGKEGNDSARSIYVAYNWDAFAVDVTLPQLGPDNTWHLAAHSEVGLAPATGSEPPIATATMHLAPRSAIVLVERR